MLQSGKRYSLRDLTDEFGVSKRTIYRDLCLLSESGVPVNHDDQKHGYIISPYTSIHTSSISKDEWSSLFLAAHIFALGCIPELADNIHQALGKLLPQLPAMQRKEYLCLMNSIDGKPSTSLGLSAVPSVLIKILKAIRQEEDLRIVYCDPNEAESQIQTKIVPQQLTAISNQWYLVGRSSWHRKIHRFDLQYIQNAQPVSKFSTHVKFPS